MERKEAMVIVTLTLTKDLDLILSSISVKYFIWLNILSG